MSEKPEHQRPRRLADWLNPTGARKAHSLIDKVYKRKNLQMAWEKVKANQGAGGVDGRVSRLLASGSLSGLINCTRNYEPTVSVRNL
ncbi:MAG: hypothetical protein ACLQFT_07005 [Steroidobacteraceae bacterium]|jgi:hypothetical protein